MKSDLLEQLPSLTFFRGRVALYAILKALGVQKGDEVALQAFTCLAVPEAIMATQGQPLYIDVEGAGVNMDPSDLERKISSKTKAVVIQHTYGIPADMTALVSIAEARGIPVVEDCCHTFESAINNKTVGNFGVASFYSYEWGKPLVVGIGGSAIINDPSLLKTVKLNYEIFLDPPGSNAMRLQLQYLAHKILYRPRLYWPIKSIFHLLGAVGAAESNYNPVKEGSIAVDFHLRMALGLRRRLVAKLGSIESVTAHSNKIVSQYDNGITSDAVARVVTPDASKTVYARYPILVKNKQELLRRAKRAGVELAEWYATPVHPLKPNEWSSIHYEEGCCPNAEMRCAEIVTLPTHPAVTVRDASRVVHFLNQR